MKNAASFVPFFDYMSALNTPGNPWGLAIEALCNVSGPARGHGNTARFVLARRAIRCVEAAFHASHAGFHHAALMLLGEAELAASACFAAEHVGEAPAFTVAA